MIYKLILLILAMSIILSGCIDIGKDQKISSTIPEKFAKINYVEENIIINGEDFPGFELMKNVYYVSSENLSLTLEAETGHGVYEVDASTTIPPGYRIYGGSETYNNSGRYILLQYKVFDKNDSLADTINITSEDVYIKNGYKYVSVNNSYNGNRVILESYATNVTDQNRIMILFGFDTVIGVIGVQDSRDKSLNESLKILDIVTNRLKVKTKEVQVTKISSIRSSNISKILSKGANNTTSNNGSKKHY